MTGLYRMMTERTPKEDREKEMKNTNKNMAFTKVTEQSSLHDNLDQKSVGQLLVEMNEEDQKVATPRRVILERSEGSRRKHKERTYVLCLYTYQCNK